MCGSGKLGASFAFVLACRKVRGSLDMSTFHELAFFVSLHADMLRCTVDVILVS